MKYIIKDWAGNVCFFGQEFETWDDAEEFLCIKLDDSYDEDRGEYYITEIENKQPKETRA